MLKEASSSRTKLPNATILFLGDASVSENTYQGKARADWSPSAPMTAGSHASTSRVSVQAGKTSLVQRFCVARGLEEDEDGQMPYQEVTLIWPPHASYTSMRDTLSCVTTPTLEIENGAYS